MLCSSSVFFFNDTATTEIYTLSLHDALPIYVGLDPHQQSRHRRVGVTFADDVERLKERHAGFHHRCHLAGRSEEHTSELQSQSNLVCRLLLEKKKTIIMLVPEPVLPSSIDQF